MTLLLLWHFCTKRGGNASFITSWFKLQKLLFVTWKYTPNSLYQTVRNKKECKWLICMCGEVTQYLPHGVCLLLALLIATAAAVNNNDERNQPSDNSSNDSCSGADVHGSCRKERYSSDFLAVKKLLIVNVACSESLTMKGLTWHDCKGDVAGSRADLVTGGADVVAWCFLRNVEQWQDAPLWKIKGPFAVWLHCCNGFYHFLI